MEGFGLMVCTGCRVWSVAQSSLRPHLCASASDDGTARLWAGRGLAEAAGTIVLPRGGAICGVSFCSDDEHALALAGADCCAYIYDLRKVSTPLQVRTSALYSTALQLCI